MQLNRWRTCRKAARQQPESVGASRRLLDFLELNRCVYLGAVVSLWIRARVPALLLRVGDGLQVARDGRAAVVETLETVFWEDQDLGALREKEKNPKTFRMLRTVITSRLI